MPSEEYTQHTVEEGEDLVSIAVEARMDADTIWNDPKNREIREKKAEQWREALGEIKESPYVLQPGDVIWIPPWKPKKVSIATDKRHTFKLKGVPEKLVLYLKNNEDPRPGLHYKLEIKESKAVYSGTTGRDGKIEHFVQTSDRHATLTIQPEKNAPRQEPEIYELLLGHLDPVSTVKGYRARLINLGFLTDEEGGEEALVTAIREFQQEYGIDPSGVVDAPTREKLIAVHKS